MPSPELVDQRKVQVKRIDSLVRPIAEAPVDFKKLDEFLASPPNPPDPWDAIVELDALVDRARGQGVNTRNEIKKLRIHANHKKKGGQHSKPARIKGLARRRSQHPTLGESIAS